MDTLVDTIYNIKLEEIDSIKFPIDKKFGLRIHINDIPYEFVLYLKKSDNLVVMGPSALNIDSGFDRSHPYFNRHKWLEHMPCSSICYNDPTLYLNKNNDELLCGWCIGTKDDWYLENICKIILLIVKNIKVNSEDIIFYGSSSGGFTSLILATMVKKSIAIADIPQFNLSMYWKGRWDPIKKYCFNNNDLILEDYSYRWDIIKMFKKENYVPNTYLVFDVLYDADFQMQYLPFLEKLNKLPFNNNSIKLIIHGNNGKHIPLSYHDTLKLINHIINLSKSI